MFVLPKIYLRKFFDILMIMMQFCFFYIPVIEFNTGNTVYTKLCTCEFSFTPLLQSLVVLYLLTCWGKYAYM